MKEAPLPSEGQRGFSVLKASIGADASRRQYLAVNVSVLFPTQGSAFHMYFNWIE